MLVCMNTILSESLMYLILAIYYIILYCTEYKRLFEKNYNLSYNGRFSITFQTG